MIPGAEHIGEEHDGWRVVAVGRTERGAAYFSCACMTCGALVRRKNYADVVQAAACRACGVTNSQTPERKARMRALNAVPALDPELRIDDDPAALELIRERGALTADEVGAAFGVTRQNVLQIEARALAKMRHGLVALALERQRVTGVSVEETIAEFVKHLAAHTTEHALSEMARMGDVDDGPAPTMRGTGWTNPPAPEPVVERWDAEHGQRAEAALAALEMRLEVLREIHDRAAEIDAADEAA